MNNKRIVLTVIFSLIILFVGTFASLHDVYADGPNLVLNPSLETSVTSGIPQHWNKAGYGTNTRTFSYPVAGVDGVKAARTSVSSYSDGAVRWYFDDIEIQDDKIYSFSDSYKSTVPTTVTVRYKMGDGTYKYKDIAFPPATGSSWGNVQTNFVPVDGAVSMTVLHSLLKVGTLDIDNVDVHEVSIDEDPSNLIKNSNLEISNGAAGLPMGWHKGGYGTNARILTYPVSGYQGGKAVGIEIGSYTNGDAKWYFDDINIQAGKTYSFSDNYKSTVSSSITVRFKTSTGTYKYKDIAFPPATGNNWSTAQANFIAPNDAVSMTVFHAIAAEGSIVIDNANIHEIIISTDPNNLIKNPNLEIFDSALGLPIGWLKGGWGTNNRSHTYLSSGNNDPKSVRVQITSYASGDAKWYFNPISVSGNESYSFSDYYNSNVPSNVTVQFGMSDGSYSYKNVGSLSPSASWKQFSENIIVPNGAVSMTIFHLIDSVGTLITDNFVLKKLPPSGFSNGMVTLSFDDGQRTIYHNALPILDSAGIKSSQAIVVKYFGFIGYMSSAQVREIAGRGHEISSHTRTHANLSVLNQSQLESEIIGSKNDLESLGLTIKTLVYPFGGIDDRIIQIVKDAGYSGARGITYGFNNKYSNKYNLSAQHVELNTTVSQIKSWIDSAIANNSWLILELHSCDYSGNQYSHTPETLQAVVDYLVSKNVQIVTLSQGLNMMNQ